MTIQHHPDDATLMSYAAGTLPEALGAVVATHLTMCSNCRNEVAAMERVGSALLAALPPTVLTKTAPAVGKTMTGQTPDEGDHVLEAIERSGDVPQPLSRIIGSDLGSVKWKRLSLGAWHLPLTISNHAKGDLRLIKIGPGQAMPEHGHGGSELSLVLAGSYSDATGRYSVGDVADHDDKVVHKPMADVKTGCICLIASEERAKFKGLFARLVQPFVGV
jgi:putative transcriptional regulator